MASTNRIWGKTLIWFMGVVATACNPGDTHPSAAEAVRFTAPVLATAEVLINEVDADQSGTDSAEFIELFDGGAGNTTLDGLVLVLINGANDSSYAAFDLDGYRTDAEGYFVVCGNAATTAECDLDVSPDTNLIQNGADAVALYEADDTDFPNGSPVTATGLVDALVYDTNDGDDTELLALLTPGEPEVNEDGAGDKDNHANGRCPNGDGGPLSTSSYTQLTPSPGAPNPCDLEQPGLSCGGPLTVTRLHTIQGAGARSPLEGEWVVVEAVVVGDFQNNAEPDDGELNGFYLQEEDIDADPFPDTAEGIFVFAPNGDDVTKGDTVRVRGQVAEYVTASGDSSMTELTNVEIAICETGSPLPTPAEVHLPVEALSDLERYEGMQVVFPEQLTISEYFDFDRYGELVLAAPPAGFDRPMQPTAVYAPGSDDAAALADLNRLSRITLDDGRGDQNPSPPRHPNGAPFGLNNRFRGGDGVTNAFGVLDDTFGRYRIQPTRPATYVPVDGRPPAPTMSGNLTVASFNVLNYFTTFGSRGADDATEFDRQRAKIFAALAAIDADIVGLIEIENNNGEALSNLVGGLNSTIGVDTYAAIETGTIGTDDITVALIYKPGTVTLDGAFAVLDDAAFTDPNHLGEPKNRPALAQTFHRKGTSDAVTVVVNHLKSKGSKCGDGDDDPEQGSCNLTRTLAASALVDWLAEDPTGSHTQTVLVIGDLNAYDKEDPITALRSGPDHTPGTPDDYIDLHQVFEGDLAYSYVFDGQFGYLDYALASAAAVSRIASAGIWHINADEPDILDYDMTYKQDPEDALYEPNAYRASDHDPVIVGLRFCEKGIRSKHHRRRHRRHHH